MIKDSDIALAQFALFSLSYCTKATLADDKLAEDFFLSLEAKVTRKMLPQPYDVKKLVAFSRLGEKQLESELSNLENNNP
jgi:hypothetical protein